jgi:hypothetical protein
MRRSSLVVVCVVVAGLLMSGLAVADPGVVSGTVTAEATGEPVAGACVTVFDDRTELHATG